MRESTVHKMVQDEAPVEKVVATAFSLTVGLAPDKQITFQSGFEGDEEDEVIYQRAAKALKLADRLRSIYEIPEAEDELAKQKETLANLIFDRDRLDRQHEHDQASRLVQLTELDHLCEEAVQETAKAVNMDVVHVQERRAQLNEDGLAAWRRSGKLGSYVAAGAVKANLKRCDDALESLKTLRQERTDEVRAQFAKRKIELQAEIDKAENERELHRGNQGVSVERWGKAIADQEAKLAKLRSAAQG